MLAYTTDRLLARFVPPTPEQRQERIRQLWHDHIVNLPKPTNQENPTP